MLLGITGRDKTAVRTKGPVLEARAGFARSELLSSLFPLNHAHNLRELHPFQSLVPPGVTDARFGRQRSPSLERLPFFLTTGFIDV